MLINYLRTYLDTLLEVSYIDPLCLEELRHNVPEHKHITSVKCARSTLAARGVYRGTHSFLRAERLFSSLTW